jgi:hypothetical protein
MPIRLVNTKPVSFQVIACFEPFALLAGAVGLECPRAKLDTALRAHEANAITRSKHHSACRPTDLEVAIDG